MIAVEALTLLARAVNFSRAKICKEFRHAAAGELKRDRGRLGTSWNAAKHRGEDADIATPKMSAPRPKRVKMSTPRIELGTSRSSV